MTTVLTVEQLENKVKATRGKVLQLMSNSLPSPAVQSLITTVDMLLPKIIRLATDRYQKVIGDANVMVITPTELGATTMRDFLMTQISKNQHQIFTALNHCIFLDAEELAKLGMEPNDNTMRVDGLPDTLYLMEQCDDMVLSEVE